MKVIVTLFVLCFAGYCRGLSCAGCPLTPCLKPPGFPCEKVFKPCGCCPVCALELGQACGSLTQPCRSDLWCAKEEKGKLIAYKDLPWFIFFKGVCTKITTCTK